MPHQAEIFIATYSGDQSAERVAREVRNLGAVPIVYEVTSVFDRSKEFYAHVDKHGKVSFVYDGIEIDPQKIKAAWYRRPNSLPPQLAKDSLRRFQLQRNIRELQDGIFRMIPHEAWLNEPYDIRRADGKVAQLSLAAKAGFTIPETVVSNTWSRIQAIKADRLIVKMPLLELESSGGERKVFYTKVLDNREDTLPLGVNPFPGVWQIYKEKRREWRVTFVGDDVFCASIYTADSAKHDWREHALRTNLVEFRAEQFPHKYIEKCRKLNKLLNLRYGCYDFIETYNGEMVFLEVNPNGQYGWLEDTVGLQISKAIAAELVKIASMEHR